MSENAFMKPRREDYMVDGFVKWGEYARDLERYVKYLETSLGRRGQDEK